MKHQFTNDLIHETSPYLLQHAHNPVHWKPWSDEVLEEAQEKNKPLLISIGYAACHWCHVMEHESFEDTLVASIMNSEFINIKVDREERPDVDQVYMNAIQLMRGQGGWPLNIVALPDGKPFWGTTYMPKEQWMESLQQLSDVYINDRKKVEEYAVKLQQGLQAMEEVIPSTAVSEFQEEEIDEAVRQWKTYFDHNMGGINRAPKFMMPNNYDFLLRRAHQTEDTELNDFVHLTLKKMAYGGVYDQIGGGFSRYSVDKKWHVPHFEKMLYDNAQLVSLYSHAYQQSGKSLYRQVVYETLGFVERELLDASNAFYSSLDADSLDEEGKLEEGAFYVWKQQDLEALLKEDYALFADYFNINAYGFWEHETYVLIREKDDEVIAATYGISAEELQQKITQFKKLLLEERSKRERPRLDDKSLTSWNALMIKGYVDAYHAFGEERFLDMAIKNGEFIVDKQFKKDGGLYHSYKAGKSTINGYLEDHATTIQAFIALFEATADTQWIDRAKALTEYVFQHFYDEKSQLFFFTSDQDTSLVVRSIEKSDNVIPASNSIMAKNLFKLGHIYGEKQYLEASRKMLNNMKQDILRFGSSHSNWLDLMSNFSSTFYEVAIVGERSLALMKELQENYIPNTLVVMSETASELPLLEQRFTAGETWIYVCIDGSCKLPVQTSDEALKQMGKVE